MMRSLVLVFAGMALVSTVNAQSLQGSPVHSAPVWLQVQSLAEAPGSPVVVRSLETNEVIGALPVDYRFMSFGSNGHITTLAVNGHLAYIPAAATTRLYPQVPREEIAPAGPSSLEQLAQEYEERVTGQAQVSLRPQNSIVNQVQERQESAAMLGANLNMGAGAGMMGMGDPMYAGPGAALAGGSVGAVGDMVGGAAGGYYGNPGFQGIK